MDELKSRIEVLKREMTSQELDKMYQGFDRHTRSKGVKVQDAERIGFVAMNRKDFIGCISGLAYKNEGVFSGWFYITDLFVDDGFRHEGLGSQLIGELERELIKIGIHSMWTWTAGYEAPSFYQKLGYSVFAQLENYYSDGSSKIAFRKKL